MSKLLTKTRDDYNGDEVDALHNDKDVELSVVTLPDAVVYPRAVVVKSVNALSA